MLESQKAALDSVVYTSDTRSDYGIVHAWHDDNHPGVFRLCDKQPCHALHHRGPA